MYVIFNDPQGNGCSIDGVSSIDTLDYNDRIPKLRINAQFNSGGATGFTVPLADVVEIGVGELTKYNISVNGGTANIDPNPAAVGQIVNISTTTTGFDHWSSPDVTFTDQNSPNTSFYMPAKNVVITINT